jgi:tRNA (guanine-N7-)-methyltransferase
MQTVRHAARIRTFHPRRGRLSGRHRDALARLWQRFGLDVAEGGEPLDPAAVFGRRAPLVLEIGSGMGEATAELAGADPDRDYLAVDVHTPGLAHLLDLVERRGLTNVRVARGDALDLLAQLAPGGLDALLVFFPDPWPKARHHKRRLLQPAHVPLLRDRLAPGGTLHVATDWADYAHAALAALAADPLLVNAHPDFAPRPARRPRTKFERRGVEAGRDVFDLVFHRAGATADGLVGVL